MGACNKHSFDDTEFDTGVKVLFQKHHDGGAHDEHSKGGHDEKGHNDHAKSEHSEKGHEAHSKDDAKEDHKEAPAKKSLFPKK